MNHDTPVLVLRLDHYEALGVFRSLGRLGVPVYAVHADRWTPGLFSKYCREGVLWDLRTSPTEQSVRFLGELGRLIGRRSVLVPTSDIGAMFVADEAARLAEWFIFPRQDRDLIRSLCSKREMYHLAGKWNVPAPRTAFPRSRTDVVQYLETAQLPVLLPEPVDRGVQFIDPLHPLAQQDFEPAGIVLFISELLAQAD